MVIKEQIMLTAFDLFSEHGIKNAEFNLQMQQNSD